MVRRMPRRLPWVWGDAVPDVVESRGHDFRVATRSVTAAAQPDALYLWLCQLRRAPYSYDWIDNWGRRSPRKADPDLCKLEIGQQFMTIFTLTEFVPKESITLTMDPGWPQRTFGSIRLKYRIDRLAEDRSQLSAVMWLPPIGRLLAAQRRYLMAWGDLVMMRKQLMVLSDLATQTPSPGTR